MGVIRSWRSEQTDELVIVRGRCGHVIEDYETAMPDGTAWCPTCDRKVEIGDSLRFTGLSSTWEPRR